MIVKLFKKLTSDLRKFACGSDGSVNVEGVIFFPLLLVTMVSTMVFYDAFRKDSLGDKATFTIGDMLSRETDFITPDYLDSSKALFTFLTGTTEAENTLRVSVVTYVGLTDSYEVVWSEVRGGHVPVLTSADLSADSLPNMLSGEQLILVDSFVDYEWPFEMGYADELMTARVFTRPRFAPQLVWLGS